MHSATIIIPTLNEEANIDPLLEKITRIRVPDCEINILFVDDQSTDNTIERIQTWSKQYPNISSLVRTTTPDLTQSILDGVAHSKSDLVLIMDADLSHPTDKIPELLKPVIDNTHDVVVGSRYVEGGGVTEWPLHRRLLSWAGGLPARILTDVKDTTSGFFACGKECFNNIDSQACGYKILIELLASGLDKFRVTECPITFTDRTRGQSKLSSKQLIQYLKRLIELSGGRMNSRTTSRFVAVGISGVFIDAIFFNIFLNLGWGISRAHISSFLIAACSNYFFNSVWSFQFEHVSISSWISRAIKYVYIGTIALILRGGVLACLIALFNISPTLAIYPAIAVAAAINYFGAAFLVFPRAVNKDPSINWRVIAVFVIVFMVVLRFLYLGTTDLLPDEAYYWNYKEHLDISYLDHPPLIAWVIWLGTTFFGDNEFGVRIFMFLSSLVSLFFIYKTTALLFDRTSAYISVLLASILPFTVVSGYLATTDGLIILFWSSGLYFIARVFIANSCLAWIGVGICVGLGLLSKYTMALLPLGIFAYMLINRNAYKWWLSPWPYISGAIALLIFMPVVYWNYINDWVSFMFQTSRRLDRNSVFSTHYLILHALILLTPTGLMLLFLAFKNTNRLVESITDDTDQKYNYKLFFIVFALVPLSVFLYFSLTHYPRFHWTSPIWLTTLPLISYYLSPTASLINHSIIINKITTYSAAILCLMYGVILHYAALGLPVNINSSMTSHYFWSETAKHIYQLEIQLEEETGTRPVIISLSKWSIASSLRFYDADNNSNNILSRNAIGKPAVMYEQWTTPGDWDGRPVIFVAMNPADLDSDEVHAHARDLEEPASLAIKNKDRSLRTLDYRIAEAYIAQ